MGRRDREPAKPAHPERYTLFTNLRWVTIAAPPLRVRCHAHALLLCDAPDIFGIGIARGEPRRQIRAFGVDPAEPVFARYWTAPNMPQLEWLPAQFVRANTGHKLNGKG